MLLLDEPTNHVDMETIDALAVAINSWDGGCVLVSHDFRLIGQVANEIWECRDGNVHKWKGTILSFKKYFRDKYAPKLGDDGTSLARMQTESEARGQVDVPIDANDSVRCGAVLVFRSVSKAAAELETVH